MFAATGLRGGAVETRCRRTRGGLSNVVLEINRYGIDCQAPAVEQAGRRQGRRPVKTKASARRASSGGASRSISRPAGGLDSAGGSPGAPPAQAASCFDCSGAGTRYGSFFFTIAQARCNNLRAVAHRATLLGFPAARKR